jgi:hypothetical protein
MPLTQEQQNPSLAVHPLHMAKVTIIGRVAIRQARSAVTTYGKNDQPDWHPDVTHIQSLCAGRALPRNLYLVARNRQGGCG